MSAVDESGECWPHPAGPPNDLQAAITYIEQCVLSSHNARKHWKVVRDAMRAMQRELSKAREDIKTLEGLSEVQANLKLVQHNLRCASAQDELIAYHRQQLTESEKERDVLRRRLVSALDRERRLSEAAK